jgi:hypothetical protein
MLANTFISQICSPPLSQVQSCDPRVMEFMDIYAIESNGNTSNDEISSYSSSTEALQ